MFSFGFYIKKIVFFLIYLCQHEKHEEKKISENAQSHKVKAEVEAGAAAGATGFAFHEHHDKKEAKKEDEVLHEKNHYYHLYHHKESENVVDYKEEEKYYKHSENLGRLDVVATGAHALVLLNS